MRVEMFTFLVAAAMSLGGALGVVLLRNTVHNALSLIATLFGIAVLFMTLGAYFLAAVQVIVYAGAIVVLFLFVIMLLGVDRIDHFEQKPLLEQRPIAVVVGLAILGLSLTALLSVGSVVTGNASTLAPIDPDTPDVNILAKVIFTDYVFALEITSVLLTIAVVGAVVLSRRGAAPIDLAEFPDGTAADVIERHREERLAAAAEQAAAELSDAELSDADDASTGTEQADSMETATVGDGTSEEATP